MEDGEDPNHEKAVLIGGEPSRKKMEVVANPVLPDELILEILYLLPARSICRFRCVSKSWCALLKRQDFISHIQDDSSFEIEVQENLLLHYIPESGSELRTVYMVRRKDLPVAMEVIAYRSCLNFICYKCDINHLYLMDLLAKKFYLLPSLPFCGVDFDFEFGFDPVSKQYKVLIWADDTTSTYDFHIITLRRSSSSTSLIPADNSWRRPLGVPLLIKGRCQKSFVTSQGIVYLFDGSEMISFDLGYEEFKSIQLPIVIHDADYVVKHPSLVIDEFPNTFQQAGVLYDQEISSKKYKIPNSVYDAYLKKEMLQTDFFYSLFEYDGCLAIAETSSFESMIGFKQTAISGIWILNDDKNTWAQIMRKMTLPASGLTGSAVWNKKHSNISATRRGEILLTASKSKSRCLMIYNFFERYFQSIDVSSSPTSANATCIEVLNV